MREDLDYNEWVRTQLPREWLWKVLANCHKEATTVAQELEELLQQRPR